MNNKLREYIDALFASAPNTDAMRELKEELLQNLTDKYNDLLAEGKTEEEAYRIAIAGIGDVDTLIGGAKTGASNGATVQATKADSSNGAITALAVVLYVLCVIPVLLISNVTGVLLMFDIIAIATGLLIWNSPKQKRPRASVIAAAVMLYILCPTPAIAMQNFASVILLFVILAIATGLLVYSGTRKDESAFGNADGAADETGAARGNKTLLWLGGIGILLVVILMAVMLIFGSIDGRHAQIFVTDEIAFGADEFFDDDEWDGETHATNPADGAMSESDGEAGKQGTANKGSANAVLSGSATVTAAGISKIEIDWVSGIVSIEVGTGDTIEFYETSEKELTDAQKLRYQVRNGKLSISYSNGTMSSWNWLDLDRLYLPRKDLTMRIPKSMVGQFEELEVNGVSANVTLSGAFAQKTDITTISGGIQTDGVLGDKLSLETVSGEVIVSDSTVRKLDIETTSGDAEAMASAESVELQTVSGSLRMTLGVVPSKLETEAVSGDVRVTLPQNASDFTAKFDTVSGGFTYDFPMVLHGERYVVGTGAAEFEFESVSGDVQILSK